MNFFPKLLIYICGFLLGHQAFTGCTNSGIVSTSQHLATKVGKNILDKGGNAIDAAVAVGYALSVVEPCCGNLGGGGFMLIRFNNGKTIFINFREVAPINIDKSQYFKKNGSPIPNKITSGYLAVAVPGTVMGLNTALEKYGTMSLQQVISPAIKLARQGFILVPEDEKTISKNFDAATLSPNIKSIFVKHGRLIKSGEKLIQKNLALSLEQIQMGGTAAFYKGPIAEKIVADSNKHGGALSKQDFLEYKVEIQKPINCHYRGYNIYSAPPPSSGGIVLCEILNITSSYPLSKLGEKSVSGTHYILEAMRHAYADRNLLGDPNFINNPTQHLLSPEHAAEIRDKIHPYKANTSLSTSTTNHEKSQTTHYSIVDKHGNAVAVTYTLNGNFGAKIIAGDTGIFLNNAMDDFNLKTGVANQFGLIQSDNNSIQPKKRPLSSMTPTIITKNNKLFMVLGAPGGSTIPTQVLETIQNVIDYHHDLQTAVDTARYHMQWQPDIVFMEPHAFKLKTIKELEKNGYHFQLGSPFGTKKWGAVAAILFNTKNGCPTGVIDKRRPAGLVLKSFAKKAY